MSDSKQRHARRHPIQHEVASDLVIARCGAQCRADEMTDDEADVADCCRMDRDSDSFVAAGHVFGGPYQDAQEKGEAAEMRREFEAGLVSPIGTGAALAAKIDETLDDIAARRATSDAQFEAATATANAALDGNFWASDDLLERQAQAAADVHAIAKAAMVSMTTEQLTALEVIADMMAAELWKSVEVAAHQVASVLNVEGDHALVAAYWASKRAAILHTVNAATVLGHSPAQTMSEVRDEVTGDKRVVVPAVHDNTPVVASCRVVECSGTPRKSGLCLNHLPSSVRTEAIGGWLREVPAGYVSDLWVTEYRATAAPHWAPANSWAWDVAGEWCSPDIDRDGYREILKRDDIARRCARGEMLVRPNPAPEVP